MTKIKTEIENNSDVKVKSLYKAIKILDCFDSTHPERGITELAEMTGMLKSSIHNIASTFAACGILKKNPKTGKFALGTKVLELSNVYSINNTLETTMKPYMQNLATESGETVYLAIPETPRVIYMDSAVSNQLNAQKYIRGVSAPMYCTAIGKAILAFLDEENIDIVIKNGLEKFTPYTIITEKDLRKELALIKKQGYAIDNMEHEYGVKCVSVPLFNMTGNVIAGLSITGPSPRFTAEKQREYSEILKNIAATVKAQLY